MVCMVLATETTTADGKMAAWFRLHAQLVASTTCRLSQRSQQLPQRHDDDAKLIAKQPGYRREAIAGPPDLIEREKAVGRDHACLVTFQELQRSDSHQAFP